MSDQENATNDASSQQPDVQRTPVGKPPVQQSLAVPDTTTAAVATTAGMAAVAAQTQSRNPASPVAAPTPTDISQQTIPSKSYGDFIAEVGLAVAKAQAALDQNSVSQAEILASTSIPALIAINEVVNEDGEIESVEPVMQPGGAKLIQYIQPTFYQFSNVTLFARFQVSSFQDNADTKITSISAGFQIGGNLQTWPGIVGDLFGGVKLNANAGLSIGGSDTSLNSSFADASSLGTSSMLAVITPRASRADTSFPPPIVGVQGPKLTISSTINSLPAPTGGSSGPSPAPLTIVLFKKNGFTPGTSYKVVDLMLSGPGSLSATSVTLSPVQGDDQRMTGTVTLYRSTSDGTGVATVRASLGTLNSSVSIAFPPSS